MLLSLSVGLSGNWISRRGGQSGGGGGSRATSAVLRPGHAAREWSGTPRLLGGECCHVQVARVDGGAARTGVACRRLGWRRGRGSLNEHPRELGGREWEGGGVRGVCVQAEKGGRGPSTPCRPWAVGLSTRRKAGVTSQGSVARTAGTSRPGLSARCSCDRTTQPSLPCVLSVVGAGCSVVLCS